MRSAKANFARCLQLIVKRVFDIAASTIGLVLFSPLLLLASLAIKLESQGPIFSVKHVYCYNNQHVRVLRFRTRSHGDVTIGEHFLIRTGLDQLPMLINVLRGEMSIVGPHAYALPPPQLNDQIAPTSLKGPLRPGLVSLEGPPTSAELSRKDADLSYISNWSLLLDAKILFQLVISKHMYFQN